MSKMLIYVLDKFVWILLIAVLTAQALQIAGVVDTPKNIGLGEISYSDGNEYEYRVSIGGEGAAIEGRGKRQAGDRSPLIDNLFNIPIATLNAVNDLVQNTRPAFQRLREAAQRRLDSSVQEARARRERAQQAQQEGPKVQADGSSSRVLLRV